MKLLHKPDKSPKPPYTSRSPSPAVTSSPNSTEEVILPNDGFQSRFKKKCIFCGNGHWRDECLRYPDIQSKQRRLTIFCLRCMKEDQKMKDCTVVGKICIHCGEKDKHHRSLCLRKFSHEVTRKPSDNLMMSNNILLKNSAREEIMSSNEETTVLSVGENAVMQTAMVEVMPPGESTSEVARVLLETGSSRTYVTEDIVKRLKLEPTESDKLTTFTYGINKLNEITSLLTTLTLKSKDGNIVNIKANVVPKIGGNMQQMPIPLKNHFSISRYTVTAN